MARFFLSTVILPLTLLLPACSGGVGSSTPGSGLPSADIIAPTVTSTSPANNATAVPVSSAITATFSEAMNPATINTTTFTLKAGATAASGTVSASGNTATFTPSVALSSATSYTATITTGTKDLAGNAIVGAFSWTFTAADIIAPTVTSTSPANNATAVPVNSAITATFSEAMNPATINTTTFTLKAGATAASGTVSASGNTATFTPSAALLSATSYTATITTGTKDLAGNALAAAFTWSFTAADIIAPTVASTTPANNATGVSVTSKISATFSEAMNPATINTTTFTLKVGATAVSGTVSFSGNTATFTPSVALSSATTYTATITTGAKDVASNAIATNFIWSFSTPAKLDVTVLGSGTVSGSGIACPLTCTASYALGSNVTLTAAPDTGHVFNGWGAACSGTTTTCTVTLTADKSVTATFSLQPFTISGIARFEKKVVDQTGLTNTIVMTPIRSADVEVVRDADLSVVATGDTDLNGNFSIEIPGTEKAAALRVRVIAQQVNSTLNIRVVDALDETVFPVNVITGAVYGVTSGVVIGPQTGALLTATADDATGRKAGAFNIFDAFIKATDFVRAVDPNAVFPPIVFRFKIGVEGESTSFGGAFVKIPEGFADRIRIGDKSSNTHDFDDSVILHEIGHYMQASFSKRFFPGGPHKLGDRLDPRIAFSEGWATFFGQAVLGSPLYIDSLGLGAFTFSVETFNATTMATTYESESASAQVLWDLFDSGALSTDGDTLALGFASIWNNGFVALRSPSVRFVYLHSLLDKLKEAGALTVDQINTNFCTVIGVCDPPFNDRFSPSSPVLFPQFVIGPNQTITCGIFDVCAVNDNTLGAPCSSVRCTFAKASAFYRLELPSAGTLTITLTGVLSLDDLDLFLFEDDQGRNIASSTFIGLGLDESITRLLQAGTYMVEVNGPSTVGPAPYTLTTSFVP